MLFPVVGHIFLGILLVPTTGSLPQFLEGNRNYWHRLKEEEEAKDDPSDKDSTSGLTLAREARSPKNRRRRHRHHRVQRRRSEPVVSEGSVSGLSQLSRSSTIDHSWKRHAHSLRAGHVAKPADMETMLDESSFLRSSPLWPLDLEQEQQEEEEEVVEVIGVDRSISSSPSKPRRDLVFSSAAAPTTGLALFAALPADPAVTTPDVPEKTLASPPATTRISTV